MLWTKESTMKGLLFLSTALVAAVSGSKLHESWMSDMKQGFLQGVYPVDLYSLPLARMVLPGTHHSGQSVFPLGASDTDLANDELGAQFLAHVSSENVRRKWAVSQDNVVFEQLREGARVLDLRFEKRDGVFYTHNGLLGEELVDIMDALNKFLTNDSYAGDDEMVVLLVSDYIAADDLSRVSELNELMTAISDSLGALMFSQTDLDSFLVSNSSSPLTDVTLQQMRDLDRNVVAFLSEDSWNEDDNEFFFATNSYVDESDDIYNDTTARTHMVDALRNGWPQGMWKVLYMSQPRYYPITAIVDDYDSYFGFNHGALSSLSDVFDAYPKLTFGNTILTSFIARSSLVELLAVLNVEYMQCSDNYTSFGDASDECPLVSDLSRGYRNTNASEACESHAWATANCMRSCGLCPYNGGAPGHECATDGDCHHPYYEAKLGQTGDCFVRNESQARIIEQPSFCLSPEPQKMCGFAYEIDSCVWAENEDGDANDTAMNAQLNDSCSFCAANYECATGYCSPDFFKCMSVVKRLEDDYYVRSDERYYFMKSKLAEDFRETIDWLRPGDPDADYEANDMDECTSYGGCLDTMDANPYLTSLIGFTVLPFVLSLLMFVCWTLVCPCWCCCDGTMKKLCCKPCWGIPAKAQRELAEEESGAKPKRNRYKDKTEAKNACVKWLPSVILAGLLCYVAYNCGYAMKGNAAMHDDLFDDDPKSFRGAVNRMYDRVLAKFNGVDPIADYILSEFDGLVSALDRALLVTEDIDATTQRLSSVFHNMSVEYSKEVVFTTNVSDCFEPDTYTAVATECGDYCTQVGDTMSDLNKTVTQSAVSTTEYLSSVLNTSSLLVMAEDTITSLVDDFNEAVSDLMNSISNASASTDEALDQIEKYDRQREMGGFVFFLLPFVWIFFAVLGYVLSNKWCFKATWCSAMYLGAAVMLVFAIFAIVTVGWADFCVRLDDFEQNLDESSLGRQLLEFSEGKNDSANADSNKNATFDLTFNTSQMFEIVNACLWANDLMEVFNLDEALNWDSFQSNLTEGLLVDVGEAFRSEELENFETEVNLLNTDEFGDETDALISALNALSPACDCPYDANISTFTREVMSANGCVGPNYEEAEYWLNVTQVDRYDCFLAYRNAYLQVKSEEQANDDAQAYIDGLQRDTAHASEVYGDLFVIAQRLETALANVSCLVEPMFERFDAMLYNYSNCGFLGAIYGDYKRVGCRVLFEDMYFIARGMMVVAFVSILVVFCAMTNEYRVNPQLKNSKEGGKCCALCCCCCRQLADVSDDEDYEEEVDYAGDDSDLDEAVYSKDYRPSQDGTENETRAHIEMQATGAQPSEHQFEATGFEAADSRVPAAHLRVVRKSSGFERLEEGGGDGRRSDERQGEGVFPGEGEGTGEYRAARGSSQPAPPSEAPPSSVRGSDADLTKSDIL